MVQKTIQKFTNSDKLDDDVEKEDGDEKPTHTVTNSKTFASSVTW